MRPTLQTALRATSLAAALVTGLSAHAATPAEMQTIKLYGDVTIAQDSVKAWGPWEQFEAPAAGNPPVLPAFRSDASSLYRPIGPVNPPTVGTIEGFATFTKLDTECDCEYAVIGTDQAKVRASYSLTNVAEIGLPSYVSGELTPHTFMGTTSIPLTSTGRLDFAGLGYSSPDSKTNVTPLYFEGIDPDLIQAWAFMVNYANKDDAPGFGVVGVRSSESQIAQLVASLPSSKTAYYRGITLVNQFPLETYVHFGSRTFDQSLHNTKVGTKYNVSGTVNGSTLIADQYISVGGVENMHVRSENMLTGPNAGGLITNFNARVSESGPASFNVSDSAISQIQPTPQPTVQPAGSKLAPHR